jgi:hypothetical protein
LARIIGTQNQEALWNVLWTANPEDSRILKDDENAGKTPIETDKAICGLP